MIYILIIVVLLFSVYKMKNSKGDSLSYRIYHLIKKEFPLILIILMTYIIYSYNNIISTNKLSLRTMSIYFRDKLNDRYNLIFEVMSKAIDSLLNPDVLKIIIILFFIKRAILTPTMVTKIQELASNIKEVSYKDIIVKLTKANKNQDKEIENIKDKEEEGLIEEEEAKKAINKIKKKKEYTALLIDNPLIAEYLYSFIIDNSIGITIPINIIPIKIKVYELQKFFTYDLSRNSIKITGLNKENESLIIEIFDELFDKDVICGNNM